MSKNKIYREQSLLNKLQEQLLMRIQKNIHFIVMFTPTG